MSGLLQGNTWHPRFAAYLVIVIATIFYIATIRHGHNWGGDFALYIAHAKNLATGHAYSDTGFVYNELEPFLSPRSYPPVFPLYLTPVYKMFSLDIQAMKIAVIVSFTLFLIVFYEYVRKRMDSEWMRLAILAAVAFAPWFWVAKDRILPDFIFMLFLYSSIMLIDKISVVRQVGLQQYLSAVGLGLVIYLAYGTRSLGMLIIPALFLYDILRRRKVCFTTLIAALVFALLYFAQNAMLHTDESYFESLKTVDSEEQETIDNAAINSEISREINKPYDDGLLAVIKSNIQVLDDRIPGKLYNYSWVMKSFWYSGDSVIPGRVLFSIMAILAITGFLGLIFKSPSIGDYFVLTYVMVLLVVPFHQQRYMMPLVPLYMLYIFKGAEQIKQVACSMGVSTYSRVADALPIVLCLIIAASYVSTYSMSNADDITRGVESSESRELFNFIRENVSEDSLLVFHKPRPLALFTGRRAVKYHWDTDTDKLWNTLTGMMATHIILPKYIVATAHRQYFLAMIEQYSHCLEVIFENSDYIMYRINSTPAKGCKLK